MNSRQKGKRGELELAKVLREHGYETRRGQQYSGLFFIYPSFNCLWHTTNYKICFQFFF